MTGEPVARNSEQRANAAFVLALTILAIAGALAVIYSTRLGPGIDGDSVRYLDAARHLVNGRGLFVEVDGRLEPLTHYPLLYPLTLASAALINVDLEAFARWLGVALMALNTISVGAIVFLWTGSRLAGALSALFFLLSPRMIEWHASVLSEPLFFLFAFWAFHFFGRYLLSTARTNLLLAALLTALAFQTRYVGASILSFMSLWILLKKQESGIQVEHAGLYMFVSGAPMVLWLFRGVLGGEQARELAFHPVSTQTLSRGVSYTLAWLNPSYLLQTRFVLPLLLAMIVFLGYRLWRNGLQIRAKEIFPLVLITFIPWYIAFVLLMITFVDAQTPLDSRILSPVFAFLIVFSGCAFAYVLQTLSNRSVRVIVACVIAWFGFSFGSSAAEAVKVASVSGLDLNAVKWRTSAAVGYLKALPPNVVVYSNWHRAVYHVAHARVLTLPRKRDPWSWKINPAYSSELTSLCRAVRAGSVIAYFENKQLPYLPSRSELHTAIPLVEAVTDSLAVVLVAGDSTRRSAFCVHDR